MITQEQCKNVIIFNFVKMMTHSNVQIQPHVHRDCVYFSKRRGEICASVVTNKMYADIIKLLHSSTRVEQVNSVPKSSSCFVDGKQILRSSSGVQLIIYTPTIKHHICIQKKYQQICYAYFKIRHFPDFIDNFLKNWLMTQHWYVPKCFTVEFLLQKMLSSSAPLAIYTQLIESVETLSS